jgi:membrane protein YdbS with pleckstrin-like domain
MAYTRRILSEDEHVELDLHPHWKVLVLPVIVLLLVVPVASYLAAIVPEGSGQTPLRGAIVVVAAVLIFLGTLRQLVRWLTTHYIVTNRRLITRHGLVARNGRDMPLTRINDISFSHTVIERVLGCGTLVVESAGERGQLMLRDVPGVEMVQRRLYELADDALEAREDGGRHDWHDA